MTAPRVAPGAVAVLLAALSCTNAPSPAPSDFSGTWEGVVLMPSGGTTGTANTALFLSQQGSAVSGTLLGTGCLLGEVHGATLSFELDFAGACGAPVAGTATISSLADRDRLSLWFQGGCGGSFWGAGTFDRMRCAAPASACPAAAAPDLVPYCADLANDPENCGACAVRCGGPLQICSQGRCAVPACTGPVPLQPPTAFYGADALWSLVLADVDGDGALDAIASGLTGSGDGAVVVLRNDGHGALGVRSVTTLATVFAGEPPYVPNAVAAGDLDGDGRLDVAAYVTSAWRPDAPATGELVTLLGNGDGSFRAGERFSTGADGSFGNVGPRVLAVADLDGDGVDDLVARRGDAPALEVRLGVRGGRLGPASEYALPAPARAVAVADLNGDGTLDVAVASWSSSWPVADGVVAVLLGNGDGTLRAAIASPGTFDAQDVAVADLDADGTPDLAVIGGWGTYGVGAADAWVLRGRGDGTFDPPLGANRTAFPRLSFMLAVADVDADGRLDLVLGSDGRGLEFLLGRGDGTFAAFENPTRGGGGLVTAADLDGDGRTDIVLSDGDGRYLVTVYRACTR